MIRQSGGHARGAMRPLGLQQARGDAALLRQEAAPDAGAAWPNGRRRARGLRAASSAGRSCQSILRFCAPAVPQPDAGCGWRRPARWCGARAPRRAPRATAAPPRDPRSADARGAALCAPGHRPHPGGALRRWLGAAWLPGGARRLRGCGAVQPSRPQITAAALTANTAPPRPRRPSSLMRGQALLHRPRADTRRQAAAARGRHTAPPPRPPVRAPARGWLRRVRPAGLLPAAEAPRASRWTCVTGRARAGDLALMGCLSGSPAPRPDGGFRAAQAHAMSERAPVPRRLCRAMIPCAAGRRRAKKTGSRVAAKGRSHGRQRDERSPRPTLRPRCRAGAQVATGRSAAKKHQPGWGTAGPTPWGCAGVTPPVAWWGSTLIGGLAFLLFQSTTG